MSLEVQSHKEA